MKRLFVLAVLLAMFTLSTASAQAQSSNNDDVYYSPKNDVQSNAVSTTPQSTPASKPAYDNSRQNTQQNYNAPNQYYQDNSSGRYQNASPTYSTTDSSTGNTYVTNNYYGNNNGGGYNPYCNYGYSPFSSGLGFGLYDGFYPGFSFGIGFGNPFYTGFYDPFYYPYSYNPFWSPYYGGYNNPYYGYYGEGFGYYSSNYNGIGSYYGPRTGRRASTISEGQSRSSVPGNSLGNTRAVNSSALASNTGRAITPRAEGSNVRASQVPFNRPNATQAAVRRQGNTYNSASRGNVPRSSFNNYNGRRSSASVAQRANYSNRNFFTPRGGSGFNSYQNSNRSQNNYQRSSGSYSRSNAGGRSSSSYSGSSRSFSGGGGGRSSGGGGGSGRK